MFVLVCAPTISEKDVLGLEALTSEYLFERQTCFPEVPLRPKHHFHDALCLFDSFVWSVNPALYIKNGRQTSSV